MEDRVRVKFTFVGGFGHALGLAFLYVRQYTGVEQPQKRIFPLKRAFLGESKGPVRQLSNQISSFRLETH